MLHYMIRTIALCVLALSPLQFSAAAEAGADDRLHALIDAPQRSPGNRLCDVYRHPFETL
jgi:hypothetical protein